MTESTSNLTRFFRNPGQLKTLEHYLLPDLLSRLLRTGIRKVNLLSAGCSTGEEPYSVAMLLSELLPEGFSFAICAVDRSGPAIASAVKACYTPNQCEGVPPLYRGRYLEREGEGYRVSEEIRERVRFELGEIESIELQEDFDLVLCRNLLTYTEEDRRTALAERLWLLMKPYSYLLIGGSESLLGVSSRFEYLECEWSSYYRKFAPE
ncbi:MAG TPA: CheR family methyltransferase [Spirochaetia bacterium]|nr:CheR family methyltransferase [Spirochaetia bacterium]